MRSFLSVTKPYIALLLATLAVVVWTLVLGSRPVSGERKPVRVVIRKGATAGEIAGVLHKSRLIRNRTVFRLTCRFSGRAALLKPGVYELSRSMSVPVIVDKLVVGQTLESWVTMPEGFTARQIADLLKAKGLADDSAFVRMTIDEGYRFEEYPFVRGHSLEGYLFPDTYLIARDVNAEVIIRMMLEAFEQKIALRCRADAQRVIEERFGLDEDSFAEGFHRIITMASMVEREARVPEDRPLIAAVLWNRLRKGMRLEVDATVSYVPGESTNNKSRVCYTDLRTASPYNTYKRDGLPPGPICNPGLASVEAVLRPASADYLFYVARPDGSHVFTRTYQEHLRAKNRIRNGGG